jgi:hypothetical protein
MYPSRPRTTATVAALARAAAVGLLAASALVGGWAGSAAADNGVPWTVGTAANDFGSGRQNYAYTLNPGGQLKDGLVVVNRGTTPLNLAVYAADGFTTKEGRLDLRTKGATSKGVGAWVQPDRQDVTIRPGQSVEVPFTVILPQNAAPGDYMGGIVTSLTQAGAAGSGNVERRVGIRIRMRVGGELKPSLSVADLRVRYSGTPNPFGKGDATVTYTIRNTGNAILGARQTVSTSGPFGTSSVHSGQIEDSPQLLPGDTWQVSVPVHGVTPALRVKGTVSLVPLLTDASGSIAPLAAVETTTHAWTVPWTLLLLLVVVVGGLVVVTRLALRRRRQAKLGESPRAKRSENARAKRGENAGAEKKASEPASRARETADQ